MIAIVEFDYAGAREIASMISGAVNIVQPDSELVAVPNGIILSGTPSDHPKILESMTIFSELVIGNIPILGICYGMQMIAELYDGVVKYTSKESGWTVVDYWDRSGIFTGYNQRELVLMHHVNSIVKMPRDFTVVASSSKTKIAAFRHKIKPIYGVLWHPEKMRKRGHILFKKFEESCVA